MTFEQSAIIDDWQTSLTGVEALLDFDSWAPGEGSGAASAGGVDVEESVLPVLEQFASRSDAAEEAAQQLEDQDERDKALSTLAMGDIEAAFVALELAREFEDGGAQVASVDEFALQADIAANLAAALRAGSRQPGSHQPDDDWLASLTGSLNTVVKKSADGIVKVGTDAVTTAVVGQLGDALAQVLSRGALGKLLDEAKGALLPIKKAAVEFLKKALAKVTQLFGEKIAEALQEWVDSKLEALPEHLVGVAAGVSATEQAWQAAADKGTDVGSLIPRVKEFEASKLQMFGWSDRGLWVYRYLAPALAAATVVGVPGGVIVGAIALALAGWLMWAAVDHSHDARRLVAG